MADLQPHVVPPGLYIVARLDGRGFRTDLGRLIAKIERLRDGR